MGTEKHEICGRLSWPPFLWLIFTRPGGYGPLAPPPIHYWFFKIDQIVQKLLTKATRTLCAWLHLILLNIVALTMWEQQASHVSDACDVGILGSKVIFKVISKSVTEAPERSRVKTLVKEFWLTADRCSIPMHPYIPVHIRNIQNSTRFCTFKGCTRFPAILQNFSERQIVWSLCSVVFHALTFKLPI